MIKYRKTARKIPAIPPLIKRGTTEVSSISLPVVSGLRRRVLSTEEFVMAVCDDNLAAYAVTARLVAVVPLVEHIPDREHP